jgi:hypothetical protein
LDAGKEGPDSSPSFSEVIEELESEDSLDREESDDEPSLLVELDFASSRWDNAAYGRVNTCYKLHSISRIEEHN